MTMTANCNPARFEKSADCLHLVALAKKADVSLFVCDQCDNSYANPITRRVHIPPPDGRDEAYAVALHELGHILDPRGYQRPRVPGVPVPPDVQYEEELAAWDWARRNATRWTEAMEYIAQLALFTYRTGLQLDARAA